MYPDQTSADAFLTADKVSIHAMITTLFYSHFKSIIKGQLILVKKEQWVK